MQPVFASPYRHPYLEYVLCNCRVASGKWQVASGKWQGVRLGLS